MAALTSSMIDKHGCTCERYKDCAILLINNRKGENGNVPMSGQEKKGSFAEYVLEVSIK
jgi:hypothetical protein